jgi:hypothetical protein
VLVHYALGGGVGHLVRARAVLRAMGAGADAVVLASSPHARHPHVAQGLQIVSPPPELEPGGPAFRGWLSDRLADPRADRILVDAFPCGLFGELAAALPAGVPVAHVARLLRWREYIETTGGRLPRFEVTYVVEPLGAEQLAGLAGCSGRVEPLPLGAPEQALPPIEPPEPFWLVAHSGPRGEVATLIAYACETRAVEGVEIAIVVASLDDPGPLPEGCRWLEMFPVAPLFGRARRLFTAAGFNVMREAAPWRERHRVLPFPRRFDDQFARASCELRATSYELRAIGGEPRADLPNCQLI